MIARESRYGAGSASIPRSRTSSRPRAKGISGPAGCRCRATATRWSRWRCGPPMATGWWRVCGPANCNACWKGWTSASSAARPSWIAMGTCWRARVRRGIPASGWTSRYLRREKPRRSGGSAPSTRSGAMPASPPPAAIRSWSRSASPNGKCWRRGGIMWSARHCCWSSTGWVRPIWSGDCCPRKPRALPRRENWCGMPTGWPRRRKPRVPGSGRWSWIRKRSAPPRRRPRCSDSTRSRT